MDSSGSQLSVIVSPQFILSLFRKHSAADFFIHSFSGRLLDPTINNVMKPDGTKYDIEQFRAQIARLINQGVPQDLNPLSELESEEYVAMSNNILNMVSNYPPTMIVLRELDNLHIEEIEQSNGLICSNVENVKENYRKWCFGNNDYDSNRKILVEGTKSNPFKHKSLSKFQFPTRDLFLMDSFISTWGLEKIESNLFPLIENLFFGKRPKHDISVTIVSRIKFKNATKFEAQQLFEILKKKYSEFANIKFRIVYIRYDKLNTIKEMDFKEGLVKELYHFLKQNVHDRFVYSNYLYAYSGTPFDYLEKDHKNKSVKTKNTELQLTSMIRSENIKQVKNRIYFQQKLLSYASKLELNAFFDIVKD